MTIGEKIRNVRIFREMTQAELGELIGLSGDRIRQYENGVRTPKPALLQSIADALHINVLALSEIDLSNEDSIMHAFFELETTKNLRLEKIDGDFTLHFTSVNMERNPMYYALERWYKAKIDTMPMFDDDAESFQKKKNIYKNWKLNYPKGKTTPTERDIKDSKHQKLIRLQQEAAELEKELNETENVPTSEQSKE